MTPKARNECRKLASNIGNATALAVLALGVLRPIFDPAVAFEWIAVVAALLIATGMWAGAFFALSRLENEE